MPRPHPPEFRRRAVELARQHAKPVAEVEISALPVSPTTSSLTVGRRRSHWFGGTAKRYTSGGRRSVTALIGRKRRSASPSGVKERGDSHQLRRHRR